MRKDSNLSKASSSNEQAAKKDEDAGVELRQNLLFMRETLPVEAVPQPTPLEIKAVAMSVQQTEEAPKVEAPFSVFVRAKFAELSDKLVGGTGSGDNPSASDDLARGKLLSRPKYRLDAH